MKWWKHLILKKQFKVLSPDEFYAKPECELVFHRDVEEIKDADALIFVASSEPGIYNGANIELGIAYGLHKPVFSLGVLVNSAMYWGVNRYNAVDEILKHLDTAV